MSADALPTLTRADAEEWLFREAALLDAWELDDWLGLFAPDASYIIPTGIDDYIPGTRTRLIHDDRRLLEERVWRLVTGPAHAQIPRSQTRRLIGNVLVEGQPGTAVVRSNFLIFEIRRMESRLFGGRYTHELVWDEENRRWLVGHRVAYLENSTLPLFNLSIIV